VIAARSFFSTKGDAGGIQENSPAQTTEAARSFAKHSNNSPAGKNQMGKGTLALGLWHSSVGMGVGSLEQMRDRSMSDDEFIPGLESLGEAEVGKRLARNVYGVKHAAIAQEWLRSKEAARAASFAAKRDAREEETLSIARHALSIAEDANTIATRDLSAAVEQARWAKWAAILAAIAAIIATKDQILVLIFGNP
jgi:hypothetical protein